MRKARAIRPPGFLVVGSPVVMPITPTVRQMEILRQLERGEDPFDGLSGHKAGGTMRSLNLMRRLGAVTTEKGGRWALTSRGVATIARWKDHF